MGVREGGWRGKADLPPGAFGRVWRHLWLSQLREGEATGIQWAEAWMLLNILQCTGQGPQQRVTWPQMPAVPRLRSSALGRWV